MTSVIMALVGAVLLGGPAAQSGLQEGDEGTGSFGAVSGQRMGLHQNGNYLR